MVRCGDVMLIGLEDVLLIAALPIKELSKQTFNGFDCDAVSFRLMIHFSSCVLSSGIRRLNKYSWPFQRSVLRALA